MFVSKVVTSRGVLKVTFHFVGKLHQPVRVRTLVRQPAANQLEHQMGTQKNSTRTLHLCQLLGNDLPRPEVIFRLIFDHLAQFLRQIP